jgi:protein-S-isoprenylcysteine O-methyltransferase Ste14
MIYIFIGVIGFMILFFFDLVALREIPFLKTAIWIVGYGLIAFSLNMTIRKGDHIPLPDYAKITGIVLATVFAILLIYSLLIEIPFKKTYLDKGAGTDLVTTGTYALTRHPGVLWFLFFFIGMFLATGSKILLIATPVWWCMDIIYVVVQDKVYFPKQFGDSYHRYQNEVPILFPTRKSIEMCFKTFFKNK